MKLEPETQRALAQKVLQAYHVHPSVSQHFRKGTKNHRLFYSERASKTFPAILYFLDNIKEYEDFARCFEATTGCMVFHATLTHTEFGDLLDLLYVPADSEEVEEFAKDASKGYFRSLCWNLTDDIRESGMIQVRPRMGGIERIQ